jgi:iron complex outermembrane receptor protein
MLRAHLSLSRIATVAVLAAATVSTPAFAQDTAPQADAGGLDDIVVTAQRREENQRNVPISVATISGDTLAAVNSAGADIRALSGRVPSLNIESSFGRTFPRFFIRGLGNTDFDLNASQPVSLVYDDVVLENPILKGFPVFDLDRVEVLRGPQGTLFGRNTPAGIVKFDSRRPTSSTNYIRASWGSFNTVNVETGLGGELGGGFSARISGLYQHRDNWVDNLASTTSTRDLEGFDDFAVRGQLQYEGGPLTVRLTGQLRAVDGTARVFRANMFSVGSNEPRFSAGLSSPTGVPSTPGAFRRDQVRTDGINFQNLDAYNGALNISYDAGAVTISSITSYWNGNLSSRGDIDGGFGNQFNPPFGPGFIPFSAQSQDDVPSLDQFTQEIRIASNNSGGFGYQFGAFAFNEKLDIVSYDYSNPTDTTAAAVATQRQKSNAFGIFGSANYAFDNGLTLQGGLRWNYDSRDFTAARPVDVRPGFLGFGGPVAPLSRSIDAQLLTWDASALYQATDEINVFARVARGYRAPSIQGRLAFGRTLSVANSERTMSYELGLKSQSSDNRLRFNLTGFYFSTSDLQLTAVGGTSNFTTLLNADRVDGYGFEAEFQARPVTGLTLTAGLSYNHNEIKDPNAFTAGCASGCTVLDPQRAGSPGIFSINGNTLPQSPRWIANWTAGYEYPVAGGHVYAFTDWYYRSRIQFFLYDSVEYSSDNQIEGGLRIGYRTDRFDIAGFARNITDNVSAVGGIDFNNLTGFVNEPRVWGVELGVNF